MKIEKSNSEEYPYTIKIRNKKINFRGWKIFEKLKYMKITTELEKINQTQNYLTPEQEKDIAERTRKCLVFDCMEEIIALNPDEYMYLLIAIRSKSVSYDIELTLECDNCHQDYKFILNLEKYIKYEADEFNPIAVNDNGKQYVFELDRIVNQEEYDNYISSSYSPFEALFVDFVMHVKMVNGKLLETEEKFNFFNNLDANLYEDIFFQWEKMRFKMNNNATIVCEHCKHADEYNIDDIPGFFPESWCN